MEVKEKILNSDQLDIAYLFDHMIQNNLVDTRAITNPHAIDKNGKIDIDIDLSKDVYVTIKCPFHETQEKSHASLHRENNTLFCFSGKCSLGSRKLNMIDLYMVLRFNVDPHFLGTDESKKEFVQAIKELAEMIGIEMSGSGRKMTEEERKERIISEIRAAAADFYQTQFKEHKDAEKARNYMLTNRGFEHSVIPFDELMEQYKVGFAPGFFGYDVLYKSLRSKYRDEDIFASGVARKYTPKGTTHERVRDFYTNGIIIPYVSRGKINNLYMRSLDTKNEDFRHMRLPGAVDVPFRYDVAKQYREIIFVEGELSSVSIVAMGSDNVMATYGTNGLRKHIPKLKELREKSNGEKCETIYLLAEPDAAGQNATKDNGMALVEAGFDVRVIRLPHWESENGKIKGDPNDVLCKYGRESKAVFEKAKAEAISFEAFMVLHILRTSRRQNRTDTTAAIKKAGIYLARAPREELIAIAFEVADLTNIPADIFLSTWTGSKEEIPGFARAVEKMWVFAVDNISLYEHLESTGKVENLILIANIDVRAFAQKLKTFTHINGIALNSNMDMTKRETLKAELKGYQFIEFTEKERIVEGDYRTKDQIMASFKPIA
jgi:DNA primase